MRRVSIWVFGILAFGILGSLIGGQMVISGGGTKGFFGGAFAFACIRLWLGDPKKGVVIERLSGNETVLGSLTTDTDLCGSMTQEPSGMV